MAPTTYTSNGTPSDAIGAQGDMVIDYGGKFLWGPKGSTSWAGTANSIVGPTGPIAPSSKSYVACGGFQRKSGQTGCFRTQFLTAVGGGGTSFGFIPVNVPMPYAGYVVAVSIAFPYVNGSNVATSLQVFKNNLNGTTSPFIDVSAVPAGGVTSPPITFAVNQYPFAAGDYLGMGVTQASSDNASTCGLFVVYTT